MRFILKNLYWCFLFLVAFGSTTLWALAFLWAVANEPTPIAPGKPLNPTPYKGLEFNTSKAYIPSNVEIERIRQHAIEVLGLDNTETRKGE